MSILSHFKAILAWHKQHDTPAAKNMRPPLTPEKIAKKLKDLPFELPAEIIALYGVHDGMKDNVPLFGSFTFLTLGDAIAEYELACEVAEELEPVDAEGNPVNKAEYWQPSWFPIFGFQGDYYLIDAAQGVKSPVYYRVGSEPAQQWYDNFSRMLRTIHSSLEQGAYFYDDDEISAEDFEKANSIREQLNTRSAKLGGGEREPIRQEIDEQPDGTKRLTTWFEEEHYLEQFYGKDQRKIGQAEYYQGELMRRDSYVYSGSNEVEITSENLMGFMMTTKTRGIIKPDGSVETTHVQTFMQDQLLFEQDMTKSEEEWEAEWDDEEE